MKASKTTLVLISILFLVFAVRLLFAFQAEPITLDSYFSIRQAEHITHTGIPLFQDPLSYGGRTSVFPPLFYYLLALFTTIFSSILGAKVLTNALYALLPLIAYVWVTKSTHDRTSAVFSALLVGFLPALMHTVFEVTSQALAAPLFFAILLGMVNLSPSRVPLLLFALVALVMTSPLSLVCAIMFIIYLLWSRLEGLAPNKKEIEISLFFIFLVIWAHMVLYKNALFFHGLGAVAQNIPRSLMSETFSTLTFFEAFISLGLLVLSLGVYGTYLAFTSSKSKQNMLLISVVTVFFLALLIRAIPLSTGLLFIGIALAMLSAEAFIALRKLASRLKLALAPYLFFFSMGILFLGLSVLPALHLASDQSALPAEQTRQAMMFLRDQASPSATILASPQEGHLITALAHRKNVMDTSYLLIPLINQRVEDIKTIYTSPFETDVIPLLRYYGITYVYLSPRVQEAYNISALPTRSASCIQLSNQTLNLYRITC